MPGKLRNCLVVLLGLLTIAGLFYLTNQGSRQRAATLTDGTRVTVLGTSRGSAFFTTEKAWQKIARRVLPTRWQGWLPEPYSGWTYGTPGGTEALTVWFALQAADGKQMHSIPWDYCLCIAEDGSQFQTVFGYSGSSRIMPPTTTVRTTPSRKPITWLCSVRCDVFPRRQAELELRFHKSGTSLGSVRVRNPFNGPFPVWTPDPLPVSHTNWPLAVTLLNPSQAPRLDSPDPQWQTAKLAKELWSDATGHVGNYTTLPKSERAWKWELLYKPNVSNASPNSAERELPPAMVPVPGPGQFQMLTNEVRGPDWKVRILYIAGAGKWALTNTSSIGLWSNSWTAEFSFRNRQDEVLTFWESSAPFLLLEASPSWALSEVGIDVTDPSSGRPCRPYQEVRSKQMQTNAYWQVHFNAPRETNNVTIKLSVAPFRHFEFLIAPAQLVGPQAQPQWQTNAQR